ncbi:Mor transcription activator family protein [Nitrosomonas marina]|uniref:Mor transcription activator family protein n=1 Tax=Nitrosomonas marina TaxID=917 RepID=A0A1H8FWD2_9PROT|nr:Mor transcription activator family protein [Nitrosomonas marina]SEN35959.1 Mor transcription activator family protein [Nitrosomonas marina]
MTFRKNSDSEALLSLIGEGAFTRLCMVFGGTRLYISDTKRSRQRLTVIVGEELAEKIMFHYKSACLNLPKLSVLEIERRKQAIIDDHKKGMSHRDLAMKYDVTDRHIRNIVSNQVI